MKKSEAQADGNLKTLKKSCLRDGPRARGGWTLVEIMVMVVVMAIAAGLVIPNIIDSRDMQAVSAARVIASDLQYAQNLAITSQASVAVTFFPTGGRYQLSWADSESPPLKHPMTKSDYNVVFSGATGFDSLRIVDTTFSQDKVTFDATGAPDNAGSIKVQAGTSVYQVSLAPATGKVTVAVP